MSLLMLLSSQMRKLILCILWFNRMTIDLKDGFYHVPVCEAHHTFLGFKWNNAYYAWTKLPFGLCVSPYFFEKTLRPVLEHIRLVC